MTQEQNDYILGVIRITGLDKGGASRSAYVGYCYVGMASHCARCP